jgi:hypothetical protein
MVKPSLKYNQIRENPINPCHLRLPAVAIAKAGSISEILKSGKFISSKEQNSKSNNIILIPNSNHPIIPILN